MTLVLVLGALLAVAILFAALRRGFLDEPNAMTILPNPYVSQVGQAGRKLEALKGRAEQNRVYLTDEGGTRRITTIEVKGENVSHVL